MLYEVITVIEDMLDQLIDGAALAYRDSLLQSQQDQIRQRYPAARVLTDLFESVLTLVEIHQGTIVV